MTNFSPKIACIMTQNGRTTEKKILVRITPMKNKERRGLGSRPGLFAMIVDQSLFHLII